MAIELWAASLERELTAIEIEKLTNLLPDERRKRVEKLSNQGKKKEPLCAYALLALSLRRKFGWQRIPEIQLGRQGKPCFPNEPWLYFNLSHTSTAVLLGFSEEGLGVDIETIRPVCRKGNKMGENPEEYFQHWVCYEAEIKRQGRGVRPHENWDIGKSAKLLKLFPDCIAAVSGTGPVSLCWRGTMEELLQGVFEV